MWLLSKFSISLVPFGLPDAVDDANDILLLVVEEVSVLNVCVMSEGLVVVASLKSSVVTFSGTSVLSVVGDSSRVVVGGKVIPLGPTTVWV